jgi:hypothetical protein
MVGRMGKSTDSRHPGSDNPYLLIVRVDVLQLSLESGDFVGKLDDALLLLREVTVQVEMRKQMLRNL